LPGGTKATAKPTVIRTISNIATGVSPEKTDYFLHPNSVVVYDTPNVVTSGTYYSGLYFNDKITWDRKLTLNVGLRYDRYSSWLPEQGNNGDGPYSVRLIYPERRDFPVYNSIVPRLSMVYDVKGNGKLALKLSYGRYASGGPTAATSTRTRVFREPITIGTDRFRIFQSRPISRPSAVAAATNASTPIWTIHGWMNTQREWNSVSAATTSSSSTS
jgi:outer membrane receptor protein involved in Fe transport